MLGSCAVDTPNGSLDCHKEVNSSKKTIEDFFGKSSQSNSGAVKKPMNLLSYFSKDHHNSPVSNGKTETSVESSVLEKLAQVPVKNDLVKKNLTVNTLDKSNSKASSLDKSNSKASSLDKNSSKASSLDKNSSKASSLDKSNSKASSLDKNSSKASSLDKNSCKASPLDRDSSDTISVDKKRKRASKQTPSGEDFVEIAQPKRFKSTDGVSDEESKTTISLPSNEPILKKIPQNISNTESKTFHQNIDRSKDYDDDDDDFISKTDATSTCKKVVSCENSQESSKRKYTKKNSKNCTNSNNNNNNMLSKQSKLKSSKNQVNVGKSNLLDKYYCEKDKKNRSDNRKSEKEKPDSFNSRDPPQNSKEISPSNSCNNIVANSELGASSSLKYLNAKPDEGLDEGCQSSKVETCENDDQNAMELSYEEFLLSQTVSEEESVDMEVSETSPEKASLSMCDSVPMSVDSVKTDVCSSQQVTVVADIHPEPSQSLPATSNTIDNSSKFAEATLKSVSSEVIRSKHQDVDDIVVLETEVLSKDDDDVDFVDGDDVSHKEQKKQTQSTADVITGKAVPSRKIKPVSKAKNQKPAVASNSVGVKCSQSTLNFEQGNLDLHSKSASAVSLGKSKGTLKALSKQSKIGAKVIVRQQNRSIHKKNQSRDIVKYKGKKSLKCATRNKSHKLSTVSGELKKRKPKISNKKTNRKKPVKISTKHSVPKDVKKSKTSPSEDRIIEAEMSEAKSGSAALSANGNRKDSLNLLKKSVKSKLDSVGRAELEETASPSTRKSLRLQEKKTVPTSCDDLVMLEEVLTPKEKESKVNSKTTLGTKDKGLNNEKNSQKGGKLAPIFMKTSKKKNGKKSKELETEEDRMRRAFLMSGLPEEAKRQQQTINSAVNVDSCDHAPFPRDNHVQQIEPTAEINHWDLGEVNLPLIELAPAGNHPIKPPPWNGSFNVLTEAHTPNTRVDHLKKFSGHSPLSASTIKMILQEIYAANPSYPAQHFYDMALKRNKVAEKSEKTAAKSETGKETVNTEDADGIAENQKGKRKSKRSLSRRRPNKKDAAPDLKADCQKPEKNDVNSEEKVCDILWTEKYQPLHSSEIVCNSSNVKKLKSWLLDWKQRNDREARKLKKLLMKQTKSKKNKEEDSNSMLSWNDDDSDFALSPSESEEDSLCNTKLLTGPQGIGKTASVYALAMELGYQVFEVNASSVRSGKKILTRLQEATQSHQVSKDKSDSTVSPQPPTDVPNAPLKNLDAPSFSTFFKVSADNRVSNKSLKNEKNLVGTSFAKKLPNNKRKKNDKDVLPVKKTIPCILRKSPETGSWKKIDLVDTSISNSLSSSDKVSNRLNIASTSLILFDEVDIVFEEDKGFWTAILHFMSSTKRPIILTSTSADFSEQFTGSCEPLHFHAPSTKTLTSHLQTLCLAENVVTKASEISDLVTYYNGDVRSCLLALQFWVNSGASGSPVNIPLSHISHTNPSLLKDNSSEPKPDAVRTENSKEVGNKLLELKDNEDASKQEFPAHLHFLENYLAIDLVQLQSLRLGNETTKTPIDVNQLDNLTWACLHCYSQNFYLCRQLFLSMLCPSRTTLPSFNLSLQTLKKVTKPDVPQATQRLKGDLYDSETSCDDVISPTVKEQSCRTDENDSKPVGICSEKCVVVSNSTEDNDLELPQKTSLSNQDENTILPSQESCDWKTLRGITKFYDCCSDIDIFLTSCLSEPPANSNDPRAVNCHSSLSAGLWDEFPIISNELRHSQTFTEHTVDIAAHLEVRSYLECRQDLASSTCAADMKELHQNTPLSTSQHHSQLVKPPQQQDRSVSLARQKAVENVIHNLPISQSLNSNTMFLDYFPVLRSICRTEKVRQLAKAKRRFFHYFDNISLQLKESTLNILSSDFT